MGYRVAFAKMFPLILFLLCISQSKAQSVVSTIELRFCYCQCSDLQWQYVWNNYGWQVPVVHPTGYNQQQQQLHGRCHSGAPRWCYVDPHLSRCPDLEESTLFPGQKVSVEACYSPPVNSHACGCKTRVVQGMKETICSSQLTVPPSRNCARGFYYSTNLERCMPRVRRGRRTE